MAPRPAADTARSAPRLYLLTPTVEDAEGFARLLEPALDGIDVAAILLRVGAATEREEINIVKHLAPIVQARGIALLIDGKADLAAKGGADGAHFSGPDAFTAAADRLRPARIAGAGGLKSRHDAMVVAEAGADYVMFGEPDAAGIRPDPAVTRERVAWWSEVFEIPCVGYAEPSTVKDITASGAEFIALGEELWKDVRGPIAALREISQMLAQTPAMESVG